MYFIYIEYMSWANACFAAAMILFSASLVISLIEILRSTRALELELSDMEGLEDPNLVDYIRTFGRKRIIPANHSFLPFRIPPFFLPTFEPVKSLTMSLLDTVNKDIVQAMKSKEEATLRALRGIKSAILLAQTEKVPVMNSVLKGNAVADQTGQTT